MLKRKYLVIPFLLLLTTQTITIANGAILMQLGGYLVLPKYIWGKFVT